MHPSSQADGNAPADQPVHQLATYTTLLRDPEETVTASGLGVQGTIQ